MAVDLLVFGPHPDDLEIGLGGTIARHVAHGSTVGLCDMTAGEMGSNGTVDERIAEAEAARVEAFGAGLPEKSPITSIEIGKLASHLATVASLHPASVVHASTSPAPYWPDRHPDHVAASALITFKAVFQTPGCAGYRPKARTWKPEWICYVLHQRLRRRRRSSLPDVSCSNARSSVRRSTRHVTQFLPAGSRNREVRVHPVQRCSASSSVPRRVKVGALSPAVHPRPRSTLRARIHDVGSTSLFQTS